MQSEVVKFLTIGALSSITPPPYSGVLHIIDRHKKGQVHNLSYFSIVFRKLHKRDHEIHLQSQIVQYLCTGPAWVPGAHQLEQGVKVQGPRCCSVHGARRRTASRQKT